MEGQRDASHAGIKPHSLGSTGGHETLRQMAYPGDELGHKLRDVNRHEHLTVHRLLPAALPVGDRHAASERPLKLDFDARRLGGEQVGDNLSDL